MICLVCSHWYYLPHCCPCSLRWYPIYPQTKAFYHIATHTQICTHAHTHTHSHMLASSPLCLAGMLMNEGTLVVFPYLCNLNTDGVFGGHPAGLNQRNSIYRSQQSPDTHTPWHPSEVSGCLTSVDYRHRIAQSPRLPPWMLCQLHLCFMRHLCEAEWILHPCCM